MAKAHDYEFGGPIGALLISTTLPLVCYAFVFACNDVAGCPTPALLEPSTLTLDKLAREVAWPGISGLLDLKTFVLTLGYYALSLALNAILPAQEVQGSELASGGRLTYRLNAFSSSMAILAVAAAGTYLQGATFPLWTYINHHYLALLTSNIIISYLLATYVYVASFSVKPNDSDKRELADGAVTGNVVYDWYMGRELNPRVNIPGCGTVDIKSFMEIRPGLLGWLILDLAFVAGQYGTYGKITDSMIIVTLSQAFYVLDALWNEPAILTTIDITTDGFGFMLAFGDLVWVPFFYSLQARYLAVHPVELGLFKTAAIVAVQLVGYYIFRAANNEKNRFRTDPNDPRVSHLKTMPTKRGTRLLISGWWGRARHINYLGDWIMSWAYCLPTLLSGYVIRRSVLTGEAVVTQGVDDRVKGWGIPVTYAFMGYFFVLLVHRAGRLEAINRRKYGRDWDRYCEIVRWSILPGVY